MTDIPLNLPILPQLANSQNVLIAGAGGGFDVFAGLPIYHALRAMGKTVHLANYSFSDLRLMTHASEADVILPGLLVGTRGPVKMPVSYLPECYLAEWFDVVQGDPTTIWAFDKTGVPSLQHAYQTLVEHLNIDAIILIDAGIDSIMRGDEHGPGTCVEDTISLASVNALEDVPVKLLAAIGFGTEVEEQVNHYRALENIADLAKIGGYLGSCALIPQMAAFQFYEQAARYVFEQEEHEASRIQTRLIPSVWGMFGDFNWYNHPKQPPVFLSPLTSLYWFFDVEKVVQRSRIARHLRDATSFLAAMMIVMSLTFEELRSREQLPL